MAILALFTVGSFWWIQTRRGRLQTFPPLSSAGAFTEQDVIVSLDLVLHNTGPAPIAVLDFRLRTGPATPTDATFPGKSLGVDYSSKHHGTDRDELAGDASGSHPSPPSGKDPHASC
ncbi:MAG TPA: hypothetical protein VF788_05675 [Pseudonocardiaceae bacterium]